MELGEKFWSRVNKTDTCWVWTAGKSNKYGDYYFNGKHFRVHRLVWESIHGPIPEKMVICHKCDNPPCCNPDHLFMGTQKDNVQDALKKGKYNYTANKNPHLRNRVYSGTIENACCGERSPLAKLKESDVRIIRELAAQGHSSWVLAKRYNVDPSAIRQVVKRQTWKHVD
jgi:hypothetical protein